MSRPWKDKGYYSQEIMKALNEKLDVDNLSNKSVIKKLYTMDEVFEAVLEYEGVIGMGQKIRSYIKEIYEIDLDEIQE